jgi:hypothetical protein
MLGGVAVLELAHLMDKVWFRGAEPAASTRLGTQMLAALDQDIIPDSEFSRLCVLEEDGCEPAIARGYVLGNPVFDGEVVEGGRIVIGHREHNFAKFAARIATEAKMVLGYDLKPTNANRLVVQDWMYRRLHKVNVRTVHIAKILPIAIPMAFFRTRDEMDVVEALESSALRSRNEESRRDPGSQLSWAAWARRLLPWAAKPKPLLFTGKLV